MPINPMWAKGLLAIIPKMFKDNKGKWSSKRTVSGVLAVACVAQIEANGLDTNTILLAFIAVIPLCFSVFEK
tara:strand:- start:1291 stop:1506 length:216 start_codon:yes stop_codon:yes gene_type:complete